MAFNFFKRKKLKKPEETAESQLEKQLQPVADVPQAKKEQETAIKATGGIKKNAKKTPTLSDALLSPHITEKATLLGENGQYVFRVAPEATKDAVKQSVEALYGVLVRNVRMIKKPAKKIRIGKREGLKPGLKKAVVQLKKGESIEVISR